MPSMSPRGGHVLPPHKRLSVGRMAGLRTVQRCWTDPADRNRFLPRCGGFALAFLNVLQLGSLVYDPRVSHLDRPSRGARSEPREVAELRALKQRQSELGDAVDMHIELIELHRRVRGRVPLPSFALSAEVLSRHRVEARPVLRFEDIPLELTDLRLLVRQVADVLRRYSALDDADYQKVQALGRDMKLLGTVSEWYRRVSEHQAAVGGVSRAAAAMTADDAG